MLFRRKKRLQRLLIVLMQLLGVAKGIDEGAIKCFDGLASEINSNEGHGR